MKTAAVSSLAHSFWFIIAGIFGYSALYAQQQAWDLKQCIQYGLENHKTNEIYKGNVEKARQVTLENIALYFPQIRGDLRFENYFKLPTQIVHIEGVDLPFSGDFEFQAGRKFYSFGSVEAEQMLFNRQLLVSFRGLKPNMAVADLSYQQNQENIIYNIAQAFIQAHILRQQMELLTNNEKKFSRQLEIVQLQVEKGVAKKMDASRISVALNNITSQLDVAAGGYEVAINRLKYAMGLKLTDSLHISDSTNIAALNLTPEASFDVNSKTEMLLQRNQLRLLEVQKKRIGAGYFPTLSFFARYSAQAFNDEFNSIFRNWFDYSSVGIKLSVPIFDGLQKSAERKQQIINLRNAQINMELSEQGFQLQYQNAAAQLKRAQANMRNNEENIALSQEVFESISLMHQQGVAPLSEFLNAETTYKESQLNYITAMLNYYTAIIEFEKAKGTMMQFYQKL